MKGYIHHLEGNTFTFDPQRQERLKERKFFIADFRASGLVIGETANFMAVLKEAPSSHKDFMVIYTGPIDYATTLSDLPEAVVGELFELMGIIYDKTQQEKEEDFVIGLHASINPQPGALNSVARPHFHVILFSKGEGIVNNVRTEVQTISRDIDNEKDKKSFGVTTFGLVTGVGMYVEFIKNPKVNIDGKEVSVECYYHQKNGTIDFTLDPSINPYIASNQKLQLKIYERCLAFLRSIECSIDVYDSSKFGFAFSTLKEEGRSVIRVGFFERGGIGGVDSIFHHKVHKTRIDTPSMPDMTQFRMEIESILS